MKSINAIDCNGKIINIGDEVEFVIVEDSLLSDLPKEDQNAIKAQKNKVLVVSNIDESGTLEIDFEYKRSDLETTYHTIWSAPHCFRLVNK